MLPHHLTSQLMEEIFMINQLMTQLSNLMKSEKYQQENNGILMPPHYLTNFEIQKYYKNKPRFNGVFSRDNLPIGLLCMGKIIITMLFISIFFV